MKLSQQLGLRYLRTKFKLLSSISKKKASKEAFDLFCTPQRRHIKPLPNVFNQAENLQLQLHELLLTGWRWNHPANRKVLILHGFESSVTNFDRYINPLIKKGYEVLAFDAPAHGRSSGKKITAPLYKQFILEINKQFGPVQSYIAHSFGGLAVSLALEEMTQTEGYRLVLIAPATETTTAIDNFFNFLRLDVALRKEFEKIIVKNGGVSAAWFSINRAMKHIKAKTLWIQDKEDMITPMKDVLRVKKENHPHIEFVFTKGLGHRRIYRDSLVIHKILDFL